MKKCEICEHKNRAEIESALMRLQPKKAEEQLREISTEFDVPVSALQIHMITHTPLHEILIDDSTDEHSIARQRKVRELDILTATVNEYFSTLQLVGMRMRKRAQDEETNTFEKALTKPLVDLYINCGSEIRSNIKTIADINLMLNGPQDSSSVGLQALANAITVSAGR